MKKELQVTQKAKELGDYIFRISERVPKKFRFTLTGRLQNTALDVIEFIYMANEVFVRSETDVSRMEERIYYQRKALTRCKLAGYLSHIMVQQQAILPKQFEVISQYVYVISNMLGAWINSDVNRIKATRG